MNPLTPEIFKAIEPKKYLTKFLDSGIRPDGREMSVCRSIEIKHNVIESALSSASVRIGDTMVIAAVKAGVFVLPQGIVMVGEKAQGQINVVCDYSLCCLGERRIAQLEGSGISKRIESVISNDSVFPKDQLNVLFLEESDATAVWDITVDLVVVRDDGCVVDAALLAAVAALTSTKLAKINHETMKVTGDTIPLVFKTVPVGVTFCRYKESFLVDPTREEEDVLPRIWMAIDPVSRNILSFQGPDLPRNNHCQYDAISPIAIPSVLGSLFQIMSPEMVESRLSVVRV